MGLTSYPENWNDSRFPAHHGGTGNGDVYKRQILGERGYYDMLLKTEKERKSVLRFNLQAFKNNYNLVDLSKMKLTYFGIKVGTCGENHLYTIFCCV